RRRRRITCIARRRTVVVRRIAAACGDRHRDRDEHCEHANGQGPGMTPCASMLLAGGYHVMLLELVWLLSCVGSFDSACVRTDMASSRGVPGGCSTRCQAPVGGPAMTSVRGATAAASAGSWV